MNFTMRPSRVLRKLKNGETVYSTKTNLTDARICQLAASLLPASAGFWRENAAIPVIKSPNHPVSAG